MFYKQVQLTDPTQNQIPNVNVYVTSGQGQVQAAIYSNGFNAPWLLQQTSYKTPVTAGGWNSVAFSSQTLTAGTYWLAVELSNTAFLQYSSAGNDYYAYQPFGTWPTSATTQSVLGNAAVMGVVCGY